MSWLPADFAHPTRVDVCPGYHLRPIRADDTPIDYPAVMGSRESLWAKYGPTSGWPPATMTEEQDRATWSVRLWLLPSPAGPATSPR